ncbi:hypothetical protein SAMN06295909_0110 [Plantibacter sp. VKM Ac-1784]|uniref:DUF2971 domain-containing protein n=1 Tax=Plantibacter elymi (nom. nud.) TaxID=199708 RepID=A0ABY1R999_9MICO|nr:hypothetical protein [Plantibacter sp. VKM Ac-1784]SMQ58137.1 hypothetical protein SAMN06295909_0110 [Plantibacter sp. VKM Ac-1784]
MRYFHEDEFDELLAPRPDSDLLWHYTDAAGVLGILESRALRLSSVRMMNDSGEMSYGLLMIRRRLEARRDAHQVDPAIVAQIEGFLGRAPQSTDEWFVACASTQKDALSQFRGYGGYAVAINAGMALRAKMPESRVEDGYFVDMNEVDADESLEAGWRRVLYSGAEVKAHIDRLLDVLVKQCDDWPGEDGHDSVSYAEALAVERVTVCAAFVKHHGFQEEREVRIFSRLPLSNSAINLRVGRFGITPYIEAEVNPRPGASIPTFLHDVRVGPVGTDQASALYGVQRAAQKLGYNNLAPSAVDLPFRE